MAANPRQGGAPLQIPLRIRPKLDALDWDAFAMIWAIWLYHQDMGYSGRFHVDELGAAVARRIQKSRIDKALTQLMRPMIEHRDGTQTPLWLDLVDDYVVLPDWFIEENPPAELWHDDTARFVRARHKELHSPKCSKLREQIKGRDRNLCRYCGCRVNWEARNSDDAATYDHVDPDGDNTLSNVVVACRRDNGRKKHRTPDQWIADDPGQGLSLLPAGTTAVQAAAVRARAGPPGSNQGQTQVKPGSNPATRPRARPSRVEPGSNPLRPDTGSASSRSARATRSAMSSVPRGDDHP